MSRRGPYRPDKSSEIAAIEARRRAAGITIDELTRKAQMTDRTYRNIRSSGRAWLRHVKALQMALRTLEQDKKREAEVFPFGVPA